MKTLIIDNYDSFTYNLYQLIYNVTGTRPLVIKNDQVTYTELCNLEFDNIVLSPGPGKPSVEADFGICKEIIQKHEWPIMGVCLGHQGIVETFGGKVEYATDVMHGRVSKVRVEGDPIFEGFPSEFNVVRYHSLIATKLGPEMDSIGETDDGLVMAVRHNSFPIWGVQFHPESILSEYGELLFNNFDKLTEEVVDEAAQASSLDIKPTSITNSRKPKYKVRFKRLMNYVPAERVFTELFNSSEHAFWLDSALVKGFSRFSYIGDGTGDLFEVLNYNVSEKVIDIKSLSGLSIKNETLFSYLDQQLKERYTNPELLPFDFCGGYVGYLGYELKGDCGYKVAHRSDHADASLMFADRFVVFDHEDNKIYLVILDLVDNPSTYSDTWLKIMSQRISAIQVDDKGKYTYDEVATEQSVPRHSTSQYKKLISDAKELIKQGETYEVCLTNKINKRVNEKPFEIYKRLRKSNPAPYAAYYKDRSLSVLCSSPERFLTIDRCGLIESKPIKGTRKRSKCPIEDESLYQELQSNEKDRSENLMIVDLVRNDIGTVAEVGTVKVSHLFNVESYETVHQLVSTIRGNLSSEYSSIDCIKALFPGGSMTGAPKLRTMEIIDELEGGPRGVYSGSLGYISLNGAVDLNIVIRTIVVEGDSATIGVGGAIIDLSDADEELTETILKSKATLGVLNESVSLTVTNKMNGELSYDG